MENTAHQLRGQLSRDRTELQGKGRECCIRMNSPGGGDPMVETHLSEQPEDDGKLPETRGIKTRATETQLKNILLMQNLKTEHLQAK